MTKRRLNGEVMIDGFVSPFYFPAEPRRVRYTSIEDLQWRIAGLFPHDKDPYQLSSWDSIRFVVRDEFGGYVHPAVVIADMLDIRHELHEQWRVGYLKRIGLSPDDGYVFRRCPIRSRGWSRHDYWTGMRSRKLGAGLRAAFDYRDLDDEVDVVKGARRSKRVKKLLTLLMDNDFQDRHTEKNWKSQRRSQWRT